MEGMWHGMDRDISVVVPKGVYYLGDPCYTVPNELWMPLLEDSEYFDKPSGTVNGHTVYAFCTAYGDGVYTDRSGNEYGVDSGLIGLVPEGLAEMKYDHDVVRKIRFDHPTYCMGIDGLLKFGHIEIDTSDEDEEEELWQDEEEDDDE